MSGMTETQQWLRELRRILNVRAVETGNAQLAAEAALVRYQNASEKLAAQSENADRLVDGLTRELDTIDAQRHQDRGVLGRILLARRDLQKFVNEHLRELSPKTNHPDRDRLVTNVKIATESLADAIKECKAGHYDEARRLLAIAVAAMGRLDLPAPPDTPARTSDRRMDPEAMRAALARSDLHKHIARNDTWGDFDLEQALSADRTEEQAKVLWNIMESAIAANAADAEWSEYERETRALIAERRDDAEPVKIYKVLILGAGASAAYYIANNESSIDLGNTLLIGNVQPWAGERGADGNINHPHNMIDPEHGQPIAAEDGLAKRAEFSTRVQAVVSRIDSKDEKIAKVAKCGSFFEVTTDKGVHYARKVISALGIGGHNKPINELTGKPLELGETDELFQTMDTFKRALDGSTPIATAYPGVKDIAIVGPNAAIDVATAILRDSGEEKPRIHWFVGIGKDPFFLDGTDNELVKDAYPDAKEFEGGIATKGIMKIYKWDFLNATGGDKPTIVYGTRSTKKVKAKQTVDLAIYAIGPDTKAMKKMFVDESSGEEKSMTLEPTYDRDQHFNLRLREPNPANLARRLKIRDEQLLRDLFDPDLSDGSALDAALPAVVAVHSQGDSATSGIEMIGASAVRMAGNDRLTYDFVSQAIAERDGDLDEEATAALRDIDRRLTEFKTMKKAWTNEKDKATKTRLEEGLLVWLEETKAALSAAEPNPTVKMYKAMAVEFLSRMTKDDGKFDSYGDRATGGMQTIVESLPVNVAVNDQLTPARAQVEAQMDVMPTDVDEIPLVTRKGGINFITSNHTVIANYVANCYPALPPPLADYLTAQIVCARRSWQGDRRPLPARQDEPVHGERQHDLRQQAAFQKTWDDRLEAFEARFRRKR